MPATRTCRRLAIGCIASLLPCTCLWAAETRLSAYTGTSWTRDSDLRLTQPGVGTDLIASGVRWDARPTRPAPYYGLRLTAFPDPSATWGDALDYTHYKMYANTGRMVNVNGIWRGAAASGAAPLNQYVQQFELSHGVNVLSINGLYRWPDARLGRIEPYVGVGLAHYWPHAETLVGNAARETGYQASGFGYQLLAGAQYKLTQRTGLFVEGKFNRGKAEVDIAGGRAETPLRTFHLVGGISFGF